MKTEQKPNRFIFALQKIAQKEDNVGLKDDMKNKVSYIIGAVPPTILGDYFIIKEVEKVPNIDDSQLTFDKTGLQFKATVLYIDIFSFAICKKHCKRI